MRRRGLLLWLSGLCSVLVLLGSAGGSRNAAGRRLHGVFGQTGVAIEVTDETTVQRYEGVGAFSGLGETVFEGEQTVDNATGVSRGRVDFTILETGDTIRFDFDGFPDGPPNAQGVFSFRLEGRFHSGTGVFHGRRGRGRAIGTFRFGIPSACDGIDGTGAAVFTGNVH